MQLPIELRHLIWTLSIDSVTLVLSPRLRGDVYERIPPYPGYAKHESKNSSIGYYIAMPVVYWVCRESHRVLKHLCQHPQQQQYGLPDWFSFDIDTISIDISALRQLKTHKWFTQVQHLVINIRSTEQFFPDDEDTEDNENGRDFDSRKNEKWFLDHLLHLQTLTFRINSRKWNFAFTFADEGFHGTYVTHWLRHWYQVMERWYANEVKESNVPWYTRVINYDAPMEEWLTPTNFLWVNKNVLWRKRKYYNEDRFWSPREEKIAHQVDELTDPEEFFRANPDIRDILIYV